MSCDNPTSWEERYMKNLFVIAMAILASGCAMQPVKPPTVVSWTYGTGNGDPVPNPSPKPTYSRLYGYGNGDPVPFGQKADKTAFVYGGENGGSMPMQFEPAK
jgi:hypothetical protein